MLYRTVLVVLALIAGAGVAGPAHADPTASTEGTMTAWDKKQTRVLAVRACKRTREGYDYASCEGGLRWLLQTRLCAREGHGKHTFFVQIGTGVRVKASILCEP